MQNESKRDSKILAINKVLSIIVIVVVILIGSFMIINSINSSSNLLYVCYDDWSKREGLEMSFQPVSDKVCDQTDSVYCGELGVLSVKEYSRLNDEEKHSCSPGRMMIDKPIMYLYSNHEIQATVRLGHPELITVSYPQYKDGWRVLVRTDGTLQDIDTKRELYSLYWEGMSNQSYDFEDGYVIPGNKTAEFLEKKLAQLGLSEREAEEFIIYWLPLMQSNKFNLIHFMTKDEIEQTMPLEVTPKPDTVIRVYMVYKNLDAPIGIPEQQLPETPTRDGFTIVEWGGSNSGGID